MRKNILVAASLLSIILHSPAARADEPLPPPIILVSSFLQLSEDQTRALIVMIQTRDATLQPIAARVHAAQEALGKVLDEPAADAATVGGLVLDIHAGEKQAGAVAQGAAASFEEVLTPEQRERLHLLRLATQVQPAIPAFKAVGLL
jgi:uncharacterized membrane protein